MPKSDTIHVGCSQMQEIESFVKAYRHPMVTDFSGEARLICSGAGWLAVFVTMCFVGLVGPPRLLSGGQPQV